MLKSKILPVKYLFNCGLTFFTTSLLTYGVNPEEENRSSLKREAEEDLNDLNPSKIKKEEPQSQSPFDYEVNKDFILFKDKQDKTITYHYNLSELFKFKKLVYIASNSTGDWHAFAVHSWSLTHHLPFLDQEPQKKYEFIDIEEEVPNKKGETKKQTIPCIKGEGDSNPLKPEKKIGYLLINIKKNLKVKVDQIETDNKDQLILDDSTFIPYFDDEKPAEWNLPRIVLKDLDDQELLHKKIHFISE